MTDWIGVDMAKATLVSLITLEHLRALDFWGRVEVGEPDACWEWAKGRTGSGYGNVHVPLTVTGLARPVAIYAHRVAYALHHGEMLAPDMVIDHTCYNTACCNPAHLELTTQLTNVRRGRKPVSKPEPFTLRDGSTRWQVRFYDYTGPRRRYLSRRFDSLAEAEAFARGNRAA